MTSTDTIFAVATPPGRSAIAVFRISGPLAEQAPPLFGARCPAAGKFLLDRLYNNSQIIDEAIILFMKSPKSSTGEDVCEIHCHGSNAVLSAVTEMLTNRKGFRPAEAGEFARRAFINNKMDLLEIEGLADLIDAETTVQLHQAWAQIDGALRGPVKQWREDLISLESKLEALIDFADEDLPDSLEAELRQQADKLIKDIAKILNDNRAGELVRDGVVLALVGPVNVGKSTIMNNLTGRPAAIVSDQAGTTRDIISVRLNIDGIPTTILDTAGVREAKGLIEAEGIRRAIDVAQHADLVLIVVDASSTDWQEDIKILSKQIVRPSLVLLNKVDKGLVGEAPPNAVLLSAHNDQDITKLIELLGEKILPFNQAQNSAIITRAHHRWALNNAHEALLSGLEHNFQISPELASEEFRRAAMALGRITGDVDVEEMLERIFLTFCIGK